MRAVLPVGLTGGIGSGKSTVAAGLVARGAVLVDADVIAREVVRPGEAAYRSIVAYFGRSVLRDDQTLDRGALAQIVFSNPSQRIALEAITHPAIAMQMLARVDAVRGRPGVVVLDIPLLDAARVRSFGLRAVVVIDLPEDEAVARLVAGRGFSEAEARSRVAAQMGRAERRGLVELVPVGAVIDNSGDAAALEVRLDEVWQMLTAADD